MISKNKEMFPPFLFNLIAYGLLSVISTHGMSLRPLIPHTTATATLTVARRDLGGAAVFTKGVGKAVFAGGCTLKGTDPDTPFVCNEASAAVDIIEANTWTVSSAPPLSEARGWVATCSSEDGQR